MPPARCVFVMMNGYSQQNTRLFTIASEESSNFNASPFSKLVMLVDSSLRIEIRRTRGTAAALWGQHHTVQSLLTPRRCIDFLLLRRSPYLQSLYFITTAN